MQQGISDMNDDSRPSVRGYGVLPNFLAPTPMNPLEGVPILPPQFG